MEAHLQGRECLLAMGVCTTSNVVRVLRVQTHMNTYRTTHFGHVQIIMYHYTSIRLVFKVGEKDAIQVSGQGM